MNSFYFDWTVFLRDSLHCRGVKVVNQCLHKGHFFPGVLHDNNGILRATAEEIGGKHHGQIGGVHLGDVDNLLSDEHLEEPDKEGEDNEVKLGKLFHECGDLVRVLSPDYGLVIEFI